VVIPLRIHVLTSTEIDTANCNLIDADIARVVGNINTIWQRAGIRFGVESILREPAAQTERFHITTQLHGGEAGEPQLWMLLPRASRSHDRLHVYHFHELPYNSFYLGDDIVIAQEGAQVKQVKGGGNDTVARVTAHALANLLGLTNVPESRNLMGDETSSVALEDSQCETASKVARTIRGVATATEVQQAAETAEAKGDAATARRLRLWLSGVPGQGAVDAGPNPK
jgi:hypothetical protein